MPSPKKHETSEQREARLRRQRAYEARRKAADPEGFRASAIASTRKYREANREKVKAASRAWVQANRHIRNETRRAWRAKNVLRMLLHEAKRRAKEGGVEFTITADDVPVMGTHCPVFGREFPPPGSPRVDETPSIDRIDPKKGYVPGNVWIIGYRANRVKNDATAEEHEMIAAAMRGRGVA